MSSLISRSRSRIEWTAEWREYERTSTAVLDAYTGPAVRGYLVRLERQLDERGLDAPLHVMQSSDGVVTPRSARERPVQPCFANRDLSPASARSTATRRNGVKTVKATPEQMRARTARFDQLGTWSVQSNPRLPQEARDLVYARRLTPEYRVAVAAFGPDDAGVDD
jgi:hypothetical protein